MFVKDYLAYINMRSDAPVVFQEAAGYAILSSLAGPRPRLALSVNKDGLQLGLWFLLLGPSSGARKTTTLEYAMDIITEALGKEAVIRWEATPTALIQRLQKREGMPLVFHRDEMGGLLRGMHNHEYMQSLQAAFCTAYDGFGFEVNRANKYLDGEKKADVDVVRNPYLVQLCGSTQSGLYDVLREDDVANGFFARFCIVESPAVTPREIPELTSLLLRARLGIINRAKAFWEKIAHQNENIWKLIQVTEAARQGHFHLQTDFNQMALDSSNPDLILPLLTRLSMSAFKIAGLIAIDRTPVAQKIVVDGESWEIAEDVIRRWAVHSISFASGIGETEFVRDCNKILTVVSSNPEGITRAKLWTTGKLRSLPPQRFDTALKALEEQERIRKQGKIYRPGEE